MSTSDVLVFAPHPDDAEYGAGGTIVRWIEEGKRVVLVVCTDGDKGSTDRGMDSKRLASLRQDEQRQAATVLGITEVVFLHLPDQGLEDSAAYRKQVVGLIRGYRPTIVATTDPYRRYVWHRDHRITGQVVLDAVFPFARDHLAYPDLLAEGLEPHKVKELWLWGSEDSNQVNDVTATFDLKLQALRCHRSQISGLTGADSFDWFRELAVEAADGQPFDLAEPFHRVRLPD